MASYEVRQYTTTTTSRTSTRQQREEAPELSFELPWSDRTDGQQLQFEQQQQVQHGSRTLDSLSRRIHQTRAGRIRDALFPETADSALAGDATLGRLTLSGGASGDFTAVQRLAEPARTLKTAVVNVINYQEDADVAAHAAVELCRLMRDSDQTVSMRAATLILLLCKKQACRLAFATQLDLIECLLAAAARPSNADMLRTCIGALCHISRSEQGCVCIFQCRERAVPLLVHLLGQGDDRVLFYSITCLRAILLCVEEARAELRACDGVVVITRLLRHGDIRFLALLVDCLQLVAFGNEETKLLILKSGGTVELVDILRRANYEKLLFVTARLLKVLSVCSSNKPVIVESGGMNALGRHLRSESGRLVINVLWTLRNLSDQAYHLRDMDQLLRDLVDLLGSQDMDYVICAAGILCNLTCWNPHNKAVVTGSNGAVALTQTLCAAQDREEVTEPVVCALRHITHQHDQAHAAAEAVRYHYGVTVLLKLLTEVQSRRPLVKAALGLCRNLALFDENCAPLREQGLVEAAVDALQQLSAPGSPGGSLISGDVLDGVASEEVTEAALACLQALCREHLSREALLGLRPPVMPLLAQALHSNQEHIQRCVAGLLAEVTADPRAAQQLEGEGAAARLTQLLHSRNDAVATYAAAILYQMAADKPADYRARLQSELAHSLARDQPGEPPAYTWNDAGGAGSVSISRQFDAHSMDGPRSYQQQDGNQSGAPSPHHSGSLHNSRYNLQSLTEQMDV
ncbi:hypothetical protein BOX15_Mlig026881g1 [Macrostomum lignano]|uniref:Armadillo repeat-containing protein 8 n=2 Tax=Macrostomum lignano TaxID=282301 RepID=A0A1I8GL97_9PLAT|nr:hypothetical protein BOX15_Mlig026881g1 [Macrostomum lignano]